MNRKERFIRVLMRAYPNAWRAEYGEELASVLAARPLRPRVIANVVLNGFWQRMKMDPPWAICGVAGFLWSVLSLHVSSAMPVYSPTFSRLTWPGFFPWHLPLALVVGVWTMWRNPSTVRMASVAALKSALLGIAPEVMVGILWVFRMHAFLHDAGGQIQGMISLGGWFVFQTDMPGVAEKFLAVTVTLCAAWSLLLGCAGALLGRIALAFKAGYQGV